MASCVQLGLVIAHRVRGAVLLGGVCVMRCCGEMTTFGGVAEGGERRVSG